MREAGPAIRVSYGVGEEGKGNAIETLIFLRFFSKIQRASGCVVRSGMHIFRFAVLVCNGQPKCGALCTAVGAGCGGWQRYRRSWIGFQNGRKTGRRWPRPGRAMFVLAPDVAAVRMDTVLHSCCVVSRKNCRAFARSRRGDFGFCLMKSTNRAFRTAPRAWRWAGSATEHAASVSCSLLARFERWVGDTYIPLHFPLPRSKLVLPWACSTVARPRDVLRVFACSGRCRRQAVRVDAVDDAQRAQRVLLLQSGSIGFRQAKLWLNGGQAIRVTSAGLDRFAEPCCVVNNLQL